MSAVRVALNKVISGGHKIHEFILDWYSADNTAAVTAAIAGELVTKNRLSKACISGKVISIETSPGSEGDLSTAVPTGLYDITISDYLGYDIAAGNLANLSSTAAASVLFNPPSLINSELTLSVTNAGTATEGRVIMRVDPQG